MYRRDQFKQDLLVEQCLEVISIEERLREIDELLEASSTARRQGLGVRCTCGAPIPGARTSAPTAAGPVGAEPVVACARTAAPRFPPTPSSARTAARRSRRRPPERRADASDGEQTMYTQAERSGDPWEG